MHHPVPLLTRRAALMGALTAALAITGSAALAQQPASTAATPDSTGPRIGQAAPDFALSGATRYGLLATPVRLADLRGKTVVLAFFFKARTQG